MPIKLAAVVVLLACSPASALDCYSSPLRDRQHWSWRQIEGRTCWYPGRPGLSKAVLRWPNGSTTVPPADLTSGSAAPPTRPRDALEDELLLESTWPELPPATFEERFRGMR